MSEFEKFKWFCRHISTCQPDTYRNRRGFSWKLAPTFFFFFHFESDTLLGRYCVLPLSVFDPTMIPCGLKKWRTAVWRWNSASSESKHSSFAVCALIIIIICAPWMLFWLRQSKSMLLAQLLPRTHAKARKERNKKKETWMVPLLCVLVCAPANFMKCFFFCILFIWILLHGTSRPSMHA